MTPYTPAFARLRRVAASTAALLFVVGIFTAAPVIARAATAASAEGKQRFDLPAGAARPMLRQFAVQAKREIVFDADAVEGFTTNAVKGELTAGEALDQMLADTGLAAGRDAKSGAFAVRKQTDAEKNGNRAIAESSGRPGKKSNLAEDAEGEKVIKLDTFEVLGRKSLNMDIKRSIDDPQPYVIFDRGRIERSGATNLEDFLHKRLPMNATVNPETDANGRGNRSAINLRGLGTNQTLILIDGHRAATAFAAFTSANTRQPDLNGIPLNAIERIEVLPTTASGLYGGSATGGVINIVMRRDYVGAQVKFTYENTFDSDTAYRRWDFSAGLNLEGGKTNLLLIGSYSDANMLLRSDRDYLQRGRAVLLANRPAAILPNQTPPLGRTTNIRSSNGSPLFGPGTPNFTSVPIGYTGGGGLAPLQANAGKYNLDPAPGAQSGTVVTGPQVFSLNATLRREFSERLTAFLELGGSNNIGRALQNSLPTTFTVNATAPNNPFGQNLQVSVPGGITSTEEFINRTYDRRIVAGVVLKLPGEWKGSADFTWNESRLARMTTPFITAAGTAAIQTGAIDVLRDTYLTPLDLRAYNQPQTGTTPFRSNLSSGAVRAAGPVIQLPAGPIVLSTLIESRREHIDDGFNATSGNNAAALTYTYYPWREQHVDSFSMETKVPLFSAERSRAWAKELDLQLSLRHDRYETNAASSSVTVGSTPVVPPAVDRRRSKLRSTDPTVGLSFRPIDSLMLRTSYGRGFLPPAVDELVPQTPLSLTGTSLVDPRRGNTAVGTYSLMFGGNPLLKPEKSESWSAGLVFTPAFLDDLRLSVDYTRIAKTDAIVSATSTAFQQFLIDNESTYSGRITRGSNLPGDSAGFAGPITGIDGTLINISEATIEAFDVQLDYRWQHADWGSFDFYSIATFQTHYLTRALPNLPEVENAGISTAFPLKFRGTAGINWTRGSWNAGWNVNYFDSYVVSTNPTIVTNQGGSKVQDQVYHDVFVGYRFGRNDRAARPGLSGRFFDNLEIRLGAKNIFNTRPPFDATSNSFISNFGDPRLATYHISIKTSL